MFTISKKCDIIYIKLKTWGRNGFAREDQSRFVQGEEVVRQARRYGETPE